MKSGVKRAIMIIAAVICVILIAVLVLNFITVRPLERLGDYNKNKVEVLSSYGMVQSMNDERKEAVDEALDSVKFSVLRSLYEFNADYNIKRVTQKDKDDNTVSAYYTTANFMNLSPAGNEFMLRFSFDGEYRTSKYFTDNDGNLIKYDTVIIVIPKAENKLQEVKIYPYIDFNIDNQLNIDEFDPAGHIGSKYYKIYRFTAKMYTFKMHEILSEEFSTGSGGTGGDIT